jgi:hypothetical protein
LNQVLSQLPMAKAVEMWAEHDEGGEQRLHAPVVEAQGGSPLCRMSPTIAQQISRQRSLIGAIISRFAGDRQPL